MSPSVKTRPPTSESEAWLVLAEEHAKTKASSYLCDNLRHVEKGQAHANPRLAAIPADVRETMVRRIKADLGGQWSAYGDDDHSWDPKMLRELRGARVLACLVFAQRAATESLK